MTRIDIANFSGLQQRANRSLTPANVAALATNADFRHGTLAALKQPRFVLTPVARVPYIASLYRIGRGLPETQYWLTWAGDVDVATSQVANDTEERIYYTGDGVPQWTNLFNATNGGTQYPVLSYTLGIPAPTVAPTLTPSSITAPTEDRVYVYTYVSAEGEEGRPSPPTTVTVAQTGTVNITGMQAGPTGNYHITRKRIYRSLTSATGIGNLLFVADIPVASTSYNDTATDAQVSANGALTSSEYDVPPADMVGIVNLQNGITIGFHGKEICPSEPFLPYAYPNKYRQTVDYNIVSIKPFGTSAAVLTQGTPYILTGVDPAALSLDRTEFRQACVAKRSAVDAGDGVIYASPDGLCYIGAGGSRILTDGIFTRDQWQAMVPSSITAAWHDGRYVAFFQAGGGFVWDGKDFVPFDDNATAVFVDLVKDALYVQVGADILQWNNGAASKTYDWAGSLIQLGGAALPPRCTVEADAYPLTFRLYANGIRMAAGGPLLDDQLLATITVNGRASFALPAKRCREFYVRLTGTPEVRYVGLGTADELRQPNAQ